MINLEKINFAYPKTKPLFSDLNLQLEAGNIYGLLGKNGAGKTTLLKIICGLLFPQTGKCKVLDFTPKERHAEFLSNVYFVPEEFYLPDLEIKKYSELYTPFYPKFDHNYFEYCLKEFELFDEKSLKTFSYGQKKKFLLAFALASNCSLVILDEPTNGLDIPSKAQLRKLMMAAVVDTTTFIISTHQVREVEHLIDPIIMLDEGKIIFQRSISEITRCLTFSTQPEEGDVMQTLYSEKTYNGYRVVSPKVANYESEVDIEMLFNAVLTNKERINKLFNVVT